MRAHTNDQVADEIVKAGRDFARSLQEVGIKRDSDDGAGSSLSRVL